VSDITKSLRRAMAETKFKADAENTRMYFYGTREEADNFVAELKNLFRSKK